MNDMLSRRGALKSAASVAGAALVLTTFGRARRALAQDPSDTDTLNALLAAEYGAIEAYSAAAPILQNPPSGDPLAGLAPAVLQIALRFLGDHQAHAEVLKNTISSLGGTPIDPMDASITAGIPADFVGNVKNVIDFAAGAEKGAAVAYTEVQKSLSAQDNAALAAAIGSTETQHFTILYLVSEGLAVPGAAFFEADGTTLKDEAGLAAAAANLSPRAFVVTRGSSKGLEDTSGLPFFTYDAP